MDDHKLKKIFLVFKGKKGSLISILQRVQEEFGYLPEEALDSIADFLRLPPSQVFSVATFYKHFFLSRRGDHLISICQGTACHVCGAHDLLAVAEKALGIKTGQTTPDFRYSLERVGCLGSCALAPAVLIDDEIYPKMTPEKLKNLLAEGLSEAKVKKTSNT